MRRILEKIKKEEQAAKPSLQAAAERVHAVAGAPMEMLIGAALMNEAHEKREAIKLEQISDAVSQVMEGVSKLAERILAEREAAKQL
jgi:ATP-dependent Zn protease